MRELIGIGEKTSEQRGRVAFVRCLTSCKALYAFERNLSFVTRYLTIIINVCIQTAGPIRLDGPRDETKRRVLDDADRLKPLQRLRFLRYLFNVSGFGWTYEKRLRNKAFYEWKIVRFAAFVYEKSFNAAEREPLWMVNSTLHRIRFMRISLQKGRTIRDVDCRAENNGLI